MSLSDSITLQAKKITPFKNGSFHRTSSDEHQQLFRFLANLTIGGEAVKENLFLVIGYWLLVIGE